MNNLILITNHINSIPNQKKCLESQNRSKFTSVISLEVEFKQKQLSTDVL